MGAFFLNSVFGFKLSYYLRHFVFAVLFVAFMFYMMTLNGNSLPYSIYALFILNVFLYPYARFVYEAIVEFIMGDNMVMLPLIIVLMYKLVVMLMLFSISIIVAPIGMIILGILNSKHQK